LAGPDAGFEIARADLQLRGMGDLFGAKQHGLPAFRIADPLRDEALNETARVVAERVLREDPELVTPPYLGLRRLLTVGYSRALELFRVG
jgi:ATP-dependent DNA helicase RecG